MAKTIKVIDLLNKIANGEEVPIEIEYRDKRYILNRTCKQYYEKGEGSYLNNKLAFKNTIEYEFYGDFLNDEVKIIEGQTIEEQQDIDHWEEIANTFREYGEVLAEKFAKIGRQIDKNIKDKE